MNCREVCKESLQIYFDSTFPERVVARRCQNKAQQYPKTAMAIEVLASVVFGTIKIITFPLLTFSNLISLP
ncbi:putative inner membrane protein, partial [Chlamydia psittaci 02DC14]